AIETDQAKAQGQERDRLPFIICVPTLPGVHGTPPYSPCRALFSTFVERRDLRIDIEPHRFHLGIFAHHLEPHLAAIAGLAEAAEGRSRMHALVAVDPHHAGMEILSDAVGALHVAGPEPCPQAVFGVVGDGDGLGFILEDGSRNEGPEYFLARDAM